jgi:hypothetical protein
MPSYHFRPARRSEAKPLIGLYAESGSGKTMSALLLARGFVGPTGTVGMLETESGRGEAYADDPRVPGSYLVVPLRDDFGPAVFGEAIAAAEKASLDALIIDSASHEWEAVGGVLHLAAQNQSDGKKGPDVWRMPKLEHQRHFMLPLLGTPIPLVILCMRARYPMEKDKASGEWRRSDALVPYQADTILFEMFVHGWIDRDHKFHGTKYTRDELRAVLRENEPITLETGQRLAAWARGTPESPPGDDRPMIAVPPSPRTSDPIDDWVTSFEGVTREACEALFRGAKIERTAAGWTEPQWARVLAAKEAAKARLGLR